MANSEVIAKPGYVLFDGDTPVILLKADLRHLADYSSKNRNRQQQAFLAALWQELEMCSDALHFDLLQK